MEADLHAIVSETPLNLISCYTIQFLSLQDSLWSTSHRRPLPIIYISDAVWSEIYPFGQCSPSRLKAWKSSRQCGLRVENLWFWSRSWIYSRWGNLQGSRQSRVYDGICRNPMVPRPWNYAELRQLRQWLGTILLRLQLIAAIDYRYWRLVHWLYPCRVAGRQAYLQGSRVSIYYLSSWNLHLTTVLAMSTSWTRFFIILELRLKIPFVVSALLVYVAFSPFVAASDSITFRLKITYDLSQSSLVSRSRPCSPTAILWQSTFSPKCFASTLLSVSVASKPWTILTFKFGTIPPMNLSVNLCVFLNGRNLTWSL